MYSGDWVTFTTEISGGKLIAIAYAWSQRGVSYLLSTCGSTEPSEKMYMSYFQDDFDNVGSKEVSRPKLAHLIYDYLPLIDEHKKQRQKKSWIRAQVANKELLVQAPDSADWYVHHGHA
jgi:hypothetical protein